MEKENVEKWVQEKLKVCGYPVFTELQEGKIYSKYEIILNVSDEFWLDYSSDIRKLGKDYFWFPMGECEKDMGINSMFGALQVMYAAYKANKHVLLHCHAGANRSPTIANAFIFMMTSEHKSIKTTRSDNMEYNMLLHNIGKHLPEKEQMEKWLLACKEAFDNPDTFLGGMYDWTLRKANLNIKP